MSKRSFVERWFPLPKALFPAAVGVDISDSLIRWLALEEKQDGVRVRCWGEKKLEAGIVSQGIVQNPGKLGQALKEIRAQWGGITCAHMSLPEEAGYVFGMRVPDVPERDQVMNVIGFELEARVPIPPSAAVFDFDATHNRTEEGVEVGVVVFSREIVDAYVAAFSAAGILLLSSEIEARSIARAVSARKKSETVELLVDFGRNRTGFAIIKDGVPIFTSTVAIGGEAIVHAVMESLSMTEEQAGTFCDEQGLAALGTESAAGVAAISETAGALAEEVVRHYHYWDTRRNERGDRVTPVERVLLVGGGANIRGLDEFLAGQVQALVTMPDVWSAVCRFDEYIPPINRRSSLQYATAVGLALRGVSQ